MRRKNSLDNEDTLSREEYLTKACSPEKLEALNTDYSVLFSDLMAYSKKIPFPGTNGEAYGFVELMKYQPLLILEQIRSYPEEDIDLDEINALLRYHPQLKLSQATQNLLNSDIPAEDRIRTLRSGYREFREDIEQAGITDPALATLGTFLRNYTDIASGFNKVMERLPEFCINHLLQVKPLPAQPDATWLVLKKTEDSHDIVIPKHTLFTVGDNQDGSDFCYRSVEKTTLAKTELHSVSSVVFQQTELAVGETIIQYVDNILQKEIKPDGNGEATALFDSSAGNEKDHSFVMTGIMIESPMLLLEEGERDVSIEFYLTGESIRSFEEYVEAMTNPKGEFINKYYRLLKDAFYLEISTEEGWTAIPYHELKYVTTERNHFLLRFQLDSEFAATANCDEKHLWTTQMPALRVLINRNAHIFPYSWARNVFFYKMVIRCDVKHLSTLELVNELGKQDVNSPFQPFGALGEKGSWFLFGNYEASIKPLREVNLTVEWAQTPREEGGFETYYEKYGEAIKNDSFQVKTEYLKGKEWIDSSPQTTPLFQYDNKSGRVENRQTVTWNLEEKAAVNTLPRNKFQYGLPATGFFRLRIEKPEFGFGWPLYQDLLINSVMLRKKGEEIKLPNEPYIPVINSLKFRYEAQETIDKDSGTRSQTKIYPINPVATKNLQPVTGRIYPLVNGNTEEGYLKFAFSRAESYRKIRMYIELIPSHHEFDKNEISILKWYYNDGSQWIKIEERCVYDETDNFLNSGIIEIELPMRVSEMHLDQEGLFWIYAAFEKNHLNYPSVYGIYTNVVKVEAILSDHPERHSGTDVLPSGSIKNLHKTIPGILSVKQPRPGRGGIDSESFNRIYFRTSNRILFQNHPVTPEDYERLVLEKFPQIDKVKCFPACDTRNDDRKGVVTLVVMQKRQNDIFPLCSYSLLFEIEKEIGKHTPPFVIVDAINPVFEEIMVRCHVKLKPGVSVNRFQNEVKEEIDNYIAPWIRTRKLPEFGHTLTVAEIRDFLEKQPAIEDIHQLSLVVLMTSTQKARLKSQTIKKTLEFSEEKAFIPIKTSHPWYIRVPAKEHLIYTFPPEEYQKKMSIGDLKIGSTFIIKEQEK